jgi:hypothetical protein
LKGFKTVERVSKIKEVSVMGAKRDAYVEEIKGKIDNWNLEIDKFQAKTDIAKAKAQAQYLKHIEELKGKRKEVEAKLDEIQRSSETAWEDVKAGADKAWKSMSETIKIARSRFK